MKRRTLLGMLTGLIAIPGALGFMKGRKDSSPAPEPTYAAMDFGTDDMTAIVTYQDTAWRGNFEQSVRTVQRAGYQERYDGQYLGERDSFEFALLTRQTVLGHGAVVSEYIDDAKTLRAQALRQYERGYGTAFEQNYDPLPPVTVWRLDSDCVAVTQTSLSEASLLQLCERINADSKGRMSFKPTHLHFPA